MMVMEVVKRMVLREREGEPIGLVPMVRYTQAAEEVTAVRNRNFLAGNINIMTAGMMNAFSEGVIR